MKKFTSLLLAVVMVFTMALAAVSVSAAETEYSISDALKLEDGTALIVKGTVVSVDTPWNDTYGNITVTIADDAGNKLYVYRLATKVELGDILTITGKMGSYNGAKQIAQGATAVITGHTEITQDYKEVTIPQALATDDGVLVIVKGTVTEIKTAWSDSYGNISVNIADDAGNVLYIYRLATKVEVGDIITVKGKMGSYNGAKQIAAGATAEITGSGSTPVVPPVDTTPTTTAPEVTDAPTAPAEPLLKDAVLADLVFKGADDTVKDTSYVERTNAAGWKATGARADAPAFTGATAAITLNGKTSAPGTLTSTVIEGGIAQLAFNYGFAFGDDQFSLTITVKKADGTVIKSDKLEKTGLTKEVAYDYILDVNTNEDVIIEIANNCLTGTDKNKDRLAIWNLCWTKPAAAPETTAPAESGDTGDTGVFFAVAAVAVVMLAGTAVISKKREN